MEHSPIDHQIASNTVLSISYAGSDGHKLPRRGLQNQGIPNLPDERRGYHPQPGSNQFIRATDVNSNYNALIARLERRFSHGLSFVAGYTYGKSIDTASGLNGTDQPQDNYDMKAERGLSDFDMRQRFVFSNNWELPFGSGPLLAARGGGHPRVRPLGPIEHSHAPNRTTAHRHIRHGAKRHRLKRH